MSLTPGVAWSLHDPTTDVLSAEPVSSKAKSAVFRMHLSCGGPAIIAKRAASATVKIESAIYREVLPKVDVSGPTWLGEVREPASDYGWMFMFDVGDLQYDKRSRRHGRLAADWLGRFHVASSSIEPPLLPDRGHPYFLERLRRSRRIVEARLDGEPASDRDILLRSIDQCHLIESYWSRLVEFNGLIPSSVVHGDFSALNIRVTEREGSSCLMPIDWEKAGWGMPFIDLVRGLDLQTYASHVITRWPSVSRSTVEEMLKFSRLLRPLTHHWEKKPAAKIEAYFLSMQDALVRLGWR